MNKVTLRSARQYTRDNKRRANTVKSALQNIARSQYPQADARLQPLRTEEEFRTALVDLLADIRHYCDSSRIAFHDLDQSAHRHYTAEVVQGRTGEEQ
jgi:hypothetical protein